MRKLTKYLLWYNILFWLVIGASLALFGLAFQKVHIGSYGLRANYFTSQIQSSYYTNGLYHKGIGYYFITYPSTKQFLLDQQVMVTNKDTETIKATYSLQYRYIFLNVGSYPSKPFRINPNELFNLYTAMSYTYPQRLTAIVNSAILEVFSSLDQNSSRVTAQQIIVETLISSNKMSVFNGAISIEAFWLDQLEFSQAQEEGYSKAYLYGDSELASYQELRIDLQKYRLKNEILSSQISNRKKIYKLQTAQKYYSQFESRVKKSRKDSSAWLVTVSSSFNASQLFQVNVCLSKYYNATKLLFE